MLSWRASASFVWLVFAAACAAHVTSEETEAFEAAFEERLDLGRADGANCSGVYVPDRASFRGRIALTFDDGPNLATTPAIVALLRQRGIPATFFINGSKVSSPAANALVRDVAADPLFQVGNHSWSHLDMKSLSSSSAISQVDRVTDVLVASGEVPRYFRFPYGSSSCSTASMVRGRDYAITGWHIDSADWCYASGRGTCPASTFRYVDSAYRSNMLGFVMKQVRQFDGGIILFHDVHANTVAALPAILDAIDAAGYEFVGLDDRAAFPLLNHGRSSFIGDRCESDDDCTWTAGAFCDRGTCSIACQGYCADQAEHPPTFCASFGGGGFCVSKTDATTRYCGTRPTTMRATVNRFIGSSTAPARTAEVCLPID